MNPRWTMFYPHDETLCSFRYPDPMRLWSQLRSIGWKPADFRPNGSARIARVRRTRNGFTIDLFTSLAAAKRAHKPAPNNPKSKTP